MFCPKCGAEYRPGFTHCNDCDVDLVEELPEPEEDSAEQPVEDELRDADLRTAWISSYRGECEAICERLDQSEIPFQIKEQAEDFFFGGSGQRFDIRVPAEFLEVAKGMAQEIVDQHASESENGEDQGAAELLDEDEDEDIPFDDAPEENLRWDPRNWIPEDATVEVWSGDDVPQAEMIQVSLREHRIYSRSDTLDDGSEQIFVMPEQELRARKIVRQIVDGTQHP